MEQQNMEAVQRIVLAGMKIMYDKSTFQMFSQAMAGKEPVPVKLAKEAAGLMKILFDKSNGSMPKRHIVPAATMLLFEMADFMKQAGIADPSEEEVQGAVKLMIPILAELYGKKNSQQQQPAMPQQQPPQGLIGQGA